jgi:hypothetical protein
MPGPGYAPPDLCSIRASARPEERAEAVHGEFSAGACHRAMTTRPRPDERHRPRHPPVRRRGRARRSGRRGVCLLRARLRGRPGPRRDRDHGPARAGHDRRPGSTPARWWRCPRPGTGCRSPPWPGGCSGWGSRRPSRRTRPRGWFHGPVGAVVAAWPAISLAGSYKLLVWLIRTSGTSEHGPSAQHLRSRATCRTAIGSLPIPAVDGDHTGGSERHASGPTRRPAGQAARLPAISPNGQRDDEGPEASTANDAAVAAYRLSVQAGNPLSERRPAQMFGRTSRRWARARIADARHASSTQDSPGAPAMA